MLSNRRQLTLVWSTARIWGACLLESNPEHQTPSRLPTLQCLGRSIAFPQDVAIRTWVHTKIYVFKRVSTLMFCSTLQEAPGMKSVQQTYTFANAFEAFCKKGIIKQETEHVVVIDTKTSANGGLQAAVFACSFCHKVFTKRQALSRHKKNVHHGRRYPCSSCEKTYSDHSALRMHVNKKHWAQSILKCIFTS